jgi:hypothetical protein
MMILDEQHIPANPRENYDRLARSLQNERRTPVSTEGVKYDNTKIQMELLPMQELREVARVLTYGAKKYAPDNWKKVPNAKERYAGALLRHFTDYREGITFDHETCPDPLRHIAQVACNALFLLYFELLDENTKANEIPTSSPVEDISETMINANTDEYKKYIEDSVSSFLRTIEMKWSKSHESNQPIV